MSQTSRVTLDRNQIIDAAIAVADRIGTDRLTIRRIATELGSSPMSIYYYLADKEEILDAMVDRVYETIGSPEPGRHWRSALETRAETARAAFRSHPWAVTLVDSRTSPGAATLQHQNDLIGFLLDAGWSFAQIGHAIALLDAYVYGFAIQEAALPFSGPDDVGEVVGAIVDESVVESYPHLAHMASEHVMRPGYDFGHEFEYGLRLIIDALEQEIEG